MMRPVYLRWIAPIAVFLLLAGCSSDSGTDTTIKQGNPDDPAFLAMQADVGEVLDSLVDRCFNPLTNPWEFPLDTNELRQDLGPFHPDDTVDYGFENGWYCLYLGSFASALNSIVVDSVMFIEHGNASTSYSIHTDAIHVKSYITTTYVGEAVNYVEQSFYLDAIYSEVDQQSASVDVDAVWQIDDYFVVGTTEVHDNLEITAAIYDLKFERSSGYLWIENTPSGGTVNLSVIYTTETTDGIETTSASREWTFDVSFQSDGTASVEVFSDNTRWTYTGNFGS